MGPAGASRAEDRPAGSNSREALDGGWPAYEFGDGTDGFSGIARRDNGESSVRLWHRSTVESPNRYSVEFQDEFNEYQQDSLSIVQAIVQLGRSLGLCITAEGVEDEAQLLLLRSMGCGSMQGYYYSQPLPAAEIRHFLRPQRDAGTLVA